MKSRIFITREIQDEIVADLNTRYQLDIHNGEPITREELLSGIAKAQGLICMPYDNIDKEAIDCAKNLKVISTYSVGFEHIDIQYAKKREIMVGHTPGVLNEATADITLGMLLDMFRRISTMDKIVRQGKWEKIYSATEHLSEDIQDKTLGIFGMGRIGQAVAKRARAFGMNIIYNNRRRLSDSHEKQIDATYVNFDDLITQSDVISIHAPHTPHTTHLFDTKIFAKMKNSAYIINTARGKIINESDLIVALQNKTIAGAGLDVFEVEPLSRKNPLLTMQNVVISPHMGSATTQTRMKMAKMVVRNLDLGMTGEKPMHSIGY